LPARNRLLIAKKSTQRLPREYESASVSFLLL
jgi:hypothetical protein